MPSYHAATADLHHRAHSSLVKALAGIPWQAWPYTRVLLCSSSEPFPDTVMRILGACAAARLLSIEDGCCISVIHCWVREGVAADLKSDDLVVLVDAHAKLCCEQVPILIPGWVGSACGQACVGGHITVLPAMQNATHRLSATCSHFWPHCHRCAQTSTASKCPALQDLRGRFENLFQAPQGDAMILFMWQDDTIDVARFIGACLERVYTSAGPPAGDQASDQP